MHVFNIVNTRMLSWYCLQESVMYTEIVRVIRKYYPGILQIRVMLNSRDYASHNRKIIA